MAWYEHPYSKGTAVGPAHLPRTFYPPSAKHGNFIGPGVLAAKRAVSRAQRWLPWQPEEWDSNYNDLFAHGRGTGNVGDSGIAGFQRQEGLTADGVLGDVTYQHMRRSLVPAGERNAGQHLFDSVCLDLLAKEVKQFGVEAQHDAAFMRLLGAMQTISEHTPGYLLGGGHGIPLSSVSVYQKLDCSSSCSLALWMAGMFEGRTYALSSWEFNQWGESGPGSYFTVYYNGTHVWIRLSSKLTRYWRFDTSPHGDGGRGPHLRYLPRYTGGFATRHWPGL